MNRSFAVRVHTNGCIPRDRQKSHENGYQLGVEVVAALVERVGPCNRTRQLFIRPQGNNNRVV